MGFDSVQNNHNIEIVHLTFEQLEQLHRLQQLQQLDQLESECLTLKQEIEQLTEKYRTAKNEFEYLTRENSKLNDVICGFSKYMTAFTSEFVDVFDTTDVLSIENLPVAEANFSEMLNKSESVLELNENNEKVDAVLCVRNGSPSRDHVVAEDLNDPDTVSQSHLPKLNDNLPKDDIIASANEVTNQHSRADETGGVRYRNSCEHHQDRNSGEHPQVSWCKAVEKFDESKSIITQNRRISIQNQAIKLKTGVSGTEVLKLMPIQVNVSGKAAFSTLQIVLSRSIGRGKFTAKHVRAKRAADVQAIDEETSIKIKQLLISNGYIFRVPVNESKKGLGNRSLSESINVIKSESKCTNEPTNEPTNELTNEATYEPTNEPTNEPSNIPINELRIDFSNESMVNFTKKSKIKSKRGSKKYRGSKKGSNSESRKSFMICLMNSFMSGSKNDSKNEPNQERISPHNNEHVQK